MARPTNAQYQWLNAAPCEESRVPHSTAVACFGRGWAEIEDVYRYQPATRTTVLVSSTFVLTDAGQAAHDVERQRRLEQIALDAAPSDLGAR